jgi:hypothetical protein
MAPRRNLRTYFKGDGFHVLNPPAKSRPDALISRFGGRRGIIHFRPYRVEEFLKIAKRVLVERENVFSPEFAEKVARATVDLDSRDMRLSVRLARVAPGEAPLQGVVKTIRRQG